MVARAKTQRGGPVQAQGKRGESRASPWVDAAFALGLHKGRPVGALTNGDVCQAWTFAKHICGQMP